MLLSQGAANESYKVSDIQVTDEAMGDFLFSLGCYPGEKVTLLSKLRSNFVIHVKNARYSIDQDLAQSIVVSNL